jgi:hypothetical protein
MTADFWQNFEGATLSTTDLAANDHTSGGVGSWNTTVDLSSKLSLGGVGETATRSSVNGTPDNGVQGMAYSLGGAAEAYVNYVFTSPKTDLVVGFWYTTCDPNDYESGPTAFVLYEDSNGNALRMIDQNDGGDSTRQLAFLSSSTVKMTIGITNFTKYWISIRYVKNGTGKIAIYNASGVQQGTTQDIVCNDYFINAVHLGSNQVGFPTQSQTVYFDDWVMNWTAPTNTIGP